MTKQTWHIDPKTADVERCFRGPGRCSRFSRGMHFSDGDRSVRYDRPLTYAWGDAGAYAAGHKIHEFRVWTARSTMPQQLGWYTVQVFDPLAELTRTLIGGCLARARPGHRLVTEIGSVYERTDREDRTWHGIAVRGVNPKRKRDYNSYDFEFEVKVHGGRIETNDGLPPYETDWTVDLSQLNL